MTNPTNLRVIPKAEWPYSVGDGWKGTFIQFDGDDGDDYRLFARCKAAHGDKPLVDDPHGTTVWVDDPNGREVKRVNREWVRDADGNYIRGRYVRRRRRTWTQIGGYEEGTGRSRTLANRPMDIVASDMPGDGPWQILIDDRRGGAESIKSNMVEWFVGSSRVEEQTLSRMDYIVEGIRHFEGRRTKAGKPYVRDLRKRINLYNLTAKERDEGYKIWFKQEGARYGI